MKRGKLVLLSLVTVLVLTGCGKKELTCTMSAEQNGVNMEQTIEVKFDGNTIDDMSIVMDVEIPENLSSQKDTFKTTYEALDFKVEEIDKGLRLTADRDSKYVKENLDLGESKANYDDAKKQFENAGYKCK